MSSSPGAGAGPAFAGAVPAWPAARCWPRPRSRPSPWEWARSGPVLARPPPGRPRAPDVAGHRAFWYSPGLVWQYARGGWARISIPAPNLSAVLHSKQGLARTALKIARNIRYGVPTRLEFLAQFSGLPSQWH